MAERQILPIEFLRECFLYTPESGDIFWNTRPVTHFPDAQRAYEWNVRYPGTRAFPIDATGYGRSEVRYEGRRYRLTAGRVAFALMTGQFPRIVDHIDGDRTHNQFANLRAAIDQENSWNLHYHKREGIPRGAMAYGSRWLSQVRHKGQKIKLGVFDTAKEAHEAYCVFVRRERGEFANTGPDYFSETLTKPADQA